MNIEEIKKLKSYDERYKYNIDKAVETKEIKYKSGKVSKLKYLSWAYAQRIAKSLDNDFKWGLVANESGSCIHENTVIIEMTFEGKIEKLRYPILNNMNQPIANPTGADINNAQMRGMAKLFAMMSGIGLYLYTNEDIESIGEEGEEGEKQQTNVQKKKEPTAKEKRERGLKYISEHKEKYEKIVNKYLLGASVTGENELNNEQVSELANNLRILEKKGA